MLTYEITYKRVALKDLKCSVPGMFVKNSGGLIASILRALVLQFGEFVLEPRDEKSLNRPGSEGLLCDVQYPVKYFPCV